MKAQGVRLIDVFLLEPFMVWFGLQSSGPDWAKYMMVATGILTMGYNWENYQRGVMENATY